MFGWSAYVEEAERSMLQLVDRVLRAVNKKYSLLGCVSL